MRSRTTYVSAIVFLAALPHAVACAPVAPKAAAIPLDPTDQRRTVEELAEALVAMYLKPEIGLRYATALRSNLQRGAYRDVGEPEALAKTLTEDLQAVSPDAHLRLLPNEVLQHPPAAEGPARSGLPEGIEEMRMIGSTAYLRFTAFPHDPRTAPAARDFLLANAGRAKAVIIDARSLPGGGIEVMDAMLPLFFGAPAVLASLETRAAGDAQSPFADGPTLLRREGRPGFVTRDHVVTPSTAERRLRDVPLFYLTSRETASAGEHLAFVLKRTKRAMLIGETTRGAGHFVALTPAGKRLTALVPVGRAFDPATGEGWEGTGVQPDVKVPAQGALDEAMRRIDELAPSSG